MKYNCRIKAYIIRFIIHEVAEKNEIFDRVLFVQIPHEICNNLVLITFQLITDRRTGA